MFQCALPSHANVSFHLLTQKHTPSLPKLKKRTLPPCVLSHTDSQQHGKSQINFTKVEASDIVQLFPPSTCESQWRKEQLMGPHSAVGSSHKHGQNSEQNGEEKARRFSAPKLSELLKWKRPRVFTMIALFQTHLQKWSISYAVTGNKSASSSMYFVMSFSSSQNKCS